MKIAVEGCAHGELDTIYNSIQKVEKTKNIKIDLLICCGDFQASRNENDLRCMAIPPKYYNMCSFYKYYSGEKKAPVLTIFIGGNHEASNYLQELPYGGWVAPNIYYLGYAGVINIAGVRIAGISGIYKGHDYIKGRFECPPYNESTKRSVYHVRNLDVFRLKQLSQPIDLFLSHDWPTGICNFGNKNQLTRFKPHFKEDIENNQLGSRPSEELLSELQPDYWFAAHLHCKFSALVPHSADKVTRFLSLDKCLPRRRYLQLVEIPHDQNAPIEIHYDLEWLTILELTNHLISIKSSPNYMPNSLGKERYAFTPTDQEKSEIIQKLQDNLKVPENFQPTAPSYCPSESNKFARQPGPVINKQTTELCEKIGISDPLVLMLNSGDCKGTENSCESVNDSFYTSFVSDSGTDNSFESSKSTPLKRKMNLSLPEPKVSLADSFEDEISSGGKSVPENSNTSETSPKIANKIERLNIGNDADIVDPVKAEQDTETPVKRFKRRNADLYKSDS